MDSSASSIPGSQGNAGTVPSDKKAEPNPPGSTAGMAALKEESTVQVRVDLQAVSLGHSVVKQRPWPGAGTSSSCLIRLCTRKDCVPEIGDVRQPRNPGEETLHSCLIVKQSPQS